MVLQNKLTDKNYIKNLDKLKAESLADEIRKFLIESVSKTGGHLASNLGVVELMLALYKNFDFPHDKIIFDVGHQCYVHKMLSNRFDKFATLRKLDGLSGFPKTQESEFDCFNTGHSSTSISAALGMARARDLHGEKYNVIAFIGDGALGGGMAFEALNDAGASDSKIIIILNDNEMSINKNVGGLSAYLSMQRLGKKYLNAKSKMHKVLSKTGSFGNAITKIVKNFKQAVKFAAIEAPMFECLGLTYIGIIDGHDFTELSEAFERAKSINGPVIIHTFTQKGKGYKEAEKNPDLYHGIGAKDSVKKNDELSYTDVFGTVLIDNARNNSQIVSITAAMGSGCGLSAFSKEFPDRFFDVGISEQHAVTMAAGLATEKTIPVVCIYSTFLQRAYDQIVHDVCLQNLHVIFAIDRAGIVGEDGETHQGIFDLSYLLHIPNIVVLAPSCKKEMIQMFNYAIKDCKSPIAIRYPRSICNDRDCSDFEFGKTEVIEALGYDIVLISIGRMVDLCLETKKLLEEHGYKVTVLNLRTIKPLNASFIEDFIDKCRIAVTVEDNVIIGGAGSYIVSKINRSLRNKVLNVGYNDCFVQQGAQCELFKLHGLTPGDLLKRIETELNVNG